jgi:peptidoglycan biosynthesis protein MviN/MurJ (putative lipid II flippase)
MVRSSFMIFIFSLLTLALGLLVQIGLASALGTGREMDAFLVAITLPAFINPVAMFAAVSALVPFLKGESDSSDPFSRQDLFQTFSQPLSWFPYSWLFLWFLPRDISFTSRLPAWTTPRRNLPPICFGS